MPWHTPEAKIEAVLKSLFDQVGTVELAGLQLLTRFEAERKRFPCLSIVGREAVQDNEGRINPRIGRWIIDCDLIMESKLRRTEGAAHDAYVGEVCDILLSSDIETRLNEIGADEELQVQQVRLMRKENSVDDGRNILATVISTRVLVVPSITQG